MFQWIAALWDLQCPVPPPRLSVWSEALPRASLYLNRRDLCVRMMDVGWDIFDVCRQNCTAIVTWMSNTVNIQKMNKNWTAKSCTMLSKGYSPPLAWVKKRIVTLLRERHPALQWTVLEVQKAYYKFIFIKSNLSFSWRGRRTGRQKCPEGFYIAVERQRLHIAGSMICANIFETRLVQAGDDH